MKKITAIKLVINDWLRQINFENTILVLEVIWLFAPVIIGLIILPITRPPLFDFGFILSSIFIISIISGVWMFFWVTVYDKMGDE